MAKQKKVKKVVLDYRHNKCRCGAKKLKTSPMCRACYNKKRVKKTSSVKPTKKVKPTLRKVVKTPIKKTRQKAKTKSNSSRDFMKEITEARKYYKEALKPSISFDDEFDMFYLWFGGNRKVSHTIEVSQDVRFDVTREGLIVSVEIEGLNKHFREVIKERNKNARTKPTTKPKARRKRK